MEMTKRYCDCKVDGMKETLEELVAKRRGYKYLTKDGKSPYQNFQYDLKSRKQMVTSLDENTSCACGPGWNLATLKWIADNCMELDGIIVECNIPKQAKIVVPDKSDGKFRTDIIQLKKIHSIESLFPALKDIDQRLKDYKPVNPITAEKMPLKSKIKEIMAQVWDQVGAQVWDQVGDQVGTQVWTRVWDQVGAQVGDQVRDQVRAQVGAQVGDQVGDQVRAQVWVCAYQVIKDFFRLDYDHPAFDLIRLGIMVVNVLGKVKVFGKNGKFLGEFE